MTATRRTTAIGAGRPGQRRSGWLPAAIIGAVAFGSASWRRAASGGQSAPRFPPVVLRYAMTLPDSAALVDHNGSGLAYAPDGSAFAYTSRLGLMLRAADRLDAVPVAGHAGRSAPSFPPTAGGSDIMDGARVVKVPLAGGAPVTICDACTGYSFSWGSDDTVRYHTAPATRSQFAGADGGVGPGRNAVRDRASRHGLDRGLPGADAGPGDPHRAVLGLHRVQQPTRGAESRHPCHHQVRSAGVQSAVGRGRIRDPRQLGRQPDRPALRCEAGPAERASRDDHA